MAFYIFRPFVSIILDTTIDPFFLSSHHIIIYGKEDAYFEAFMDSSSCLSLSSLFFTSQTFLLIFHSSLFTLFIFICCRYICIYSSSHPPLHLLSFFLVLCIYSINLARNHILIAIWHISKSGVHFPMRREIRYNV
jgi:hypothetical protein